MRDETRYTGKITPAGQMIREFSKDIMKSELRERRSARRFMSSAGRGFKPSISSGRLPTFIMVGIRWEER